jgi:hypothetical protein
VNTATQGTGLNDETTRWAILELLQVGTPIRHACDHVGVSKSAFYQRQNDDPEFAQQVRRARAKAVKMLVSRVVAASEQDWRAASWLLGRMVRVEEWSESEPQPPTVTTIKEEPRFLSDEELNELLKQKIVPVN